MFDRTKVRVTRLRSVGEIVHDLGKLYRQVRRGDVETLEGFRRASILGIMRHCLEHYEEGFPKLPACLDRKRAENA
jgi:hypothetical protein